MRRVTKSVLLLWIWQLRMRAVLGAREFRWAQPHTLILKIAGLEPGLEDEEGNFRFKPVRKNAGQRSLLQLAQSLCSVESQMLVFRPLLADMEYELEHWRGLAALGIRVQYTVKFWWLLLGRPLARMRALVEQVVLRRL